MFTYAYSLADRKIKIESFASLDDALARARHDYRTRRGDGWKFAAIRDGREVVLYDEQRFKDWLRQRKAS